MTNRSEATVEGRGCIGAGGEEGRPREGGRPQEGREGDRPCEGGKQLLSDVGVVVTVQRQGWGGAMQCHSLV